MLTDRRQGYESRRRCPDMLKPNSKGLEKCGCPCLNNIRCDAWNLREAGLVVSEKVADEWFQELRLEASGYGGSGYFVPSIMRFVYEYCVDYGGSLAMDLCVVQLRGCILTDGDANTSS
jgi:hypothetical protein